MALKKQHGERRSSSAAGSGRFSATRPDLLGNAALAVSLITPLMFFATYCLAFLGVLQRLPHFDGAAVFKVLSCSSPLAVAIGAAAFFRRRSKSARYALVLGALGSVIWVMAMLFV